jgi:hypothetical protein
MLCSQPLLFSIFGVKLDLLTFKVVWPAFAEKQLVFATVVHHELALAQLKAIFVIFNDKAGKQLMIYDVWDLFIMELQKVRERFSQK